MNLIILSYVAIIWLLLWQLIFFFFGSNRDNDISVCDVLFVLGSLVVIVLYAVTFCEWVSMHVAIK
jgi:hypothetical protein